jgi:DNA recombination protein RmuC
MLPRAPEMGLTQIAVFMAVLVLVLLAAWGLASLLRGPIEARMAALRQELQAMLQAQAQTMTHQLGELTQALAQQLGQVRQAVQHGVTDSGRLASEAQKAVAEQLRTSTEMLGQIRQQLGEVQQAGRDLSQAAHTLEMVLGGARTRGTLGEVGLERLLADTLPRASYAIQYRFSTGAVVDAIIRAGDRLAPIDSKFPLDNYRRIAESGEEARKDFSQDVRKHADSIAAKYILPSEGTLDFALMFVPSESVYYELLVTEDARLGRLDDYCRSKHVIPVSPNTLHAYLGIILMGLKGMQVEENARRLLGSLAGLQKQFESFAEVYEKLGSHLRNAQQSYAEADRKLERARLDLEQMAQGALPESAAKALAPAAKD